ncbi:putative flippase GtrA [Sphingobium sp. B2D3A]|uniref:GtrA family protein n=1 Tax=unclassified Sphingobium TaxID=2611147 RepID=UPI0022240FF1|nr:MULTISPECIES: GtrA family protein [unclassified Sphingobium]MCW2338996.1 putative flippase GtrA [Sphingobium sp. B2D3A]MCW2385421.1 putative flippase GtrA [Sphingobium sp. B2D3D]
MIGGQLVRYVLTGGFVTALQAGVYWVLAQLLGVHPQLANVCGYLVAVATGYVLHGRFTFRGHGSRDRPVAQAVRFGIVSLLSLALNAFWVWLCVERLMLALWSPIPLMGVVTPVLVFTLNRQWVFR